MTTDLHSGEGVCQSTAGILIKPARAVIELGATQDVLTRTLSAVHHANRNGDITDFIAVALPGMRMGRNCMMPGFEIELIGSETSLRALLALDGMATLRRRGMLEDPEISEVYGDAIETGAAYVRDRRSEKHTPGWIRRSQARAARRGKSLGKPVTPKAHDPAALTLTVGNAVLHIREHVGDYTGEQPRVSTYGFSAAASPAILPVLPDSVRGEVMNAD